ncbi:MAG: hypothetical protein KJO54_09830 [Gammaproteobacteria bacterium]|nr:hypothetical protein [Gammaproteobacteria bacterium]NNF62227.1 hypothetical protein [Gammaproteobacteria bacterium]NNM21024.1 hypothetical protein [Gammaproteobacteria bacterium]
MSFLRVVLVNLLVLEFLAVAGVYALGIVKPQRRLDLFLDQQLENVDQQRLEDYLAGSFHQQLGWSIRPGTSSTGVNKAGNEWQANYDARGARVSCTDSADMLIASYGDSYTHGDEVANDATWQCVMEQQLGQRVINYGVPGYGVGQALLRMQQHWDEGRIAPVTLLVIYTDDMRRVLNNYRPFVNPNTAGKLAFKPGYRAINGQVVFRPNPLTPATGTPDLVRQLALRIAPDEFWTRQYVRVLPRFPYSLSLARAGQQMFASEGGLVGYALNVWDTREARDVAMHLLEKFAADAAVHGTEAAVMFIPHVNSWSRGRQPADYADFVDKVLRPAGLDLTIVDFADARFDEAKFSIVPFKGHPSPQGNQQLAQFILAGLALPRGNQ